MKTKIINYDKLKGKDINNHIIRVKALIVNSENKILIAESFKTPQFIGGHLQANEDLNTALKREVLEESGITLKKEYNPFLCLKYYLKDYPTSNLNTSLEIYYFYIPTDEPYNPQKMHLDSIEKRGKFFLTYVPLIDLPFYLKNKELLNPINKIINREMNMALAMMRKEVKHAKI